MTQKDLSAKTGITQADISRIENGTRNPSLSMVRNHGLLQAQERGEVQLITLEDLYK